MSYRIDLLTELLFIFADDAIKKLADASKIGDLNKVKQLLEEDIDLIDIGLDLVFRLLNHQYKLTRVCLKRQITTE